MMSRWIIQLATFLFLYLISVSAKAQPISDSVKSAIMDEGKRLYRSELATWYATDIFKTKYKSLARRSSSVFSYASGPETITVFHTGDAQPVVLFTIRFNEHFSRQHAIIELNERSLTPLEVEYHLLKRKTMDHIKNDPTFPSYRDVNRHIIPLINGIERKVYVISAPKFEGSLIFGNDYLLQFSENSELITSQSIHKLITPVEYGVNNVYNSSEITTTTHTHNSEAGEFITATDICTLLMYQKFTNWKQHVVIGENVVTVWNCDKNDFLTLRKSDWNTFQREAERKNTGKQQ